MRTRIKEKDDIKIFILFLMRRVGYPLDFSTINDLVLQDEFVDSFDFQECFHELFDIGNIAIVGENELGHKLYAATERGETIADNLDSRLLGTIRERALQSASRLLSFERAGARIEIADEDNGDGTYELRCTVLSGRERIMNIEVTLESKYTLEKMKLHFKERPEVVYRGMLALLSGDMDYIIG